MKKTAFLPLVVTLGSLLPYLNFEAPALAQQSCDSAIASVGSDIQNRIQVDISTVRTNQISSKNIQNPHRNRQQEVLIALNPLSNKANDFVNSSQLQLRYA